LREEAGSIEYLKKPKKKKYENDSLEITKYSDSFNGYKIEYFYLTYDNQDFEEVGRSTNVLNINLVSPSGELFPIDGTNGVDDGAEEEVDAYNHEADDIVSEKESLAEKAFYDGDVEQAIMLSNEAYKEQVKRTSKTDTRALQIERQQAIYLMDADKLKESEKIFQKNLKSWSDTVGKDSPYYAMTAGYYARLLMQKKMKMKNQLNIMRVS
jgi:hypothetical protein